MSDLLWAAFFTMTSLGLTIGGFGYIEDGILALLIIASFLTGSYYYYRLLGRRKE